MKKGLITAIATLCSLSLYADDVTPGITISRTDGSSTSIPLSELQSIKFNDGSMIVNKKDRKQQCFIIDEIAIITFEDITTAINVLTRGNLSNGSISITDMSGRTVYTGKVTDAGHTRLPAGIYVLRANGKTCKVRIK